MTSKRTVLTLLTLCLLGAAEPCLALDHELKEFTLRHQRGTRTYYVYDATRPHRRDRPPLVFALHGGGGSARHTFNTSNWAELADREGIIVIYPEGTDGNWNDGRGKPSATGNDVTQVDDVGFFAKLFNRAVDLHGADPERIFVTGGSNGGTMTYRLAIELGHRFRAGGASIANLPEALTRMRPTSKVPMLIMNGTEDPIMTWDGSPSDLIEVGAFTSTLETLAYWVRNNQGCARPRISSTMLPDVNTRDGSTVEVSVVSRLDAPVVLYTIHGGGHTMPGSDGSIPRAIMGNTNQDIDGVTEIWAFFVAVSGR